MTKYGNCVRILQNTFKKILESEVLILKYNELVIIL